jgi:hypothetical protein
MRHTARRAIRYGVDDLKATPRAGYGCLALSLHDGVVRVGGVNHPPQRRAR